MMINVYSVKDSKCGFGAPIVCINDEMALRQFIGSVRAETPNVCNTFPEDKSFYKLGAFDEETGAFTSDIRLIAQASTYVVPPAKPDEVAADREAKIRALQLLLEDKDKLLAEADERNKALYETCLNLERRKIKCKKSKN